MKKEPPVVFHRLQKHCGKPQAVFIVSRACPLRHRWARPLFFHKLCGKGSIHRTDGIRVRLDLGPVIGEQPIHLILHIRQLGIHQRRESFFQLGKH